ncbi:type II restriction endonuclease [Rhizobium leguminosarum]|uniref:type II restriction endonuclease n=1 Tax=Rhizobium TaxID=379 RepID=UPI00103F0CE2|nr:type II restriction endonuclease [Rhizobium leguminosarum]TCA72264.1 type II restriction endonuclease [Rhizobium leguminosarum bv. viciae]
MAVADLINWMDEFGSPDTVWFAKRLAANDTLATKSNQAGPYIPKELLFQLFPSLNQPDVTDPDVWFDMHIDSHADAPRVRAVWYNNKLRGKTRDEARITNFGGRRSAMLNPDSTGTIAVFAFTVGADGTAKNCHVWVCGGDGTEADVVEERLGPVEPKAPIIWRPGLTEPIVQAGTKPKSSCWLDDHHIPDQWLVKFPTGIEVIEKTLLKRPARKGAGVDARLLARRSCEYEIFRSVEQATWLPRIQSQVHTIDSFLGIASSILQSRKSRAGKSLEYHVRGILQEEGLIPDLNFAYNPKTEGRKQPDFIFPSLQAYQDPSFPPERLRMLAAKTTCKDRWRQILNEANRIPVKHLLTLQQGVSKNQFEEMTDAGVRLVVPAPLHRSYPRSVRPHLITLAQFIGDIRAS